MRGLKLSDLAFLASLAPKGPQLPSDLTGLVRWYKADSFSLPDATAIGGVTHPWVDQSSSAVNATQTTGANQPLFKTGIVNGKPVIRFSAAGPNFLNFTLLSLSQLTIIVISASTNDHCPLGHNAQNMQVRIHDPGTNEISIYPAGNQVISEGLNHPMTTFQDRIWRRDGSNIMVYREDKVLIPSAGSAAGTLLLNMVGGTVDGAALYATSDIAEICIYNQLQVNADLDALYDNYFKPRYALP